MFHHCKNFIKKYFPVSWCTLFMVVWKFQILGGGGQGGWSTRKKGTFKVETYLQFSLCQRLLQAVVIDVNLCKFIKEYYCGICWTFNELFAFYHKKVLLLFRWKTDVPFCITIRRSQLTISLTCFVIKQKPLVKTVKTHRTFL